MSSRPIALLAFLTGGLVAGHASAGGFGIPEIGVRRTAMASIVGRPDDPSAIYHNPAGLVLQPGWQLYVSTGVSLLDTEFRLSPWIDSINGTQVSSDQFLGVSPESDGYYKPVKPTRAMGIIPMIAATAEILPGKLWGGVAVYVGNATGAAFAEDAPTRYHLIDGYVVAPQAVVSAAYRIAPSLSVGLTAGIINLRVHGRRYFYPIIRNADGSVLDARASVGDRPELMLDGSAWAPTWTLAAFGQPHPRVTWGATVTGRTDATLEGQVGLKYTTPQGEDVSETARHKTSQLLPWAFMAGVNIDVTPNLELGSEYRYWLYRQYEKQHTDIVGTFLVRQFETIKNYHDSWEASGGARVHDLAALPGIELMAGMQYDKSPAPEQTVTLDQPSFSHWGLHSGVRYSFGRYRVGASYIHYWYQVPTITDSLTAPPSNISGHGANNIFTASLEVKL